MAESQMPTGPNSYHFIQPHWYWVGWRCSLQLDPTDTSPVGDTECHPLLPGREWKSRSLLSLTKAVSAGESEHPLLASGGGWQISCPEQPLTSLSKGISMLPPYTRQETGDKLPALKVRSLPSTCFHRARQSYGRSNPHSAPLKS